MPLFLSKCKRPVLCLHIVNIFIILFTLRIFSKENKKHVRQVVFAVSKQCKRIISKFRLFNLFKQKSRLTDQRLKETSAVLIADLISNFKSSANF